MGQLAAVARAVCAAAIIGATPQVARAGSVTIDNGVTGTGFTSFSPDDFGSFGFLIGQQFDDEFHPPAVANPFTPTYLSGPMLFVTTPDATTSSVILSGTKFWWDFVENPPPQPDGIVANHADLIRSVTTPIALTGTREATSAFRVASALAGFQLDFGLVQRLSSDAVEITSQIDQIYTITNNGTTTVDLVFHLAWDPDLFFNSENKSSDDHVGIGAGLCGVYQHDGDARWSVALGNGPMSTVPLAYFFAGKEGFVPGAGPAFSPISAAIDQQHIWINHGMPVEWRNFVVGPGVGATGESDPALVGDATLGTEYRFSLATGASETIHIRRYYGATAVPCFGGANPSCGNGIVDPGEQCDGDDTPTCNGTTCSASECGDGYPNAAAGEQCDDAGETATCNASCTPAACGDGYANAAAGELCDDAGETAACNANCTAATCGDGYANAVAGEACDDGGDSALCNANCTPAACGDGYVNVAAAEDCEGGALCTPTCTYDFVLGGGCAGCGAGRSGGAGAWWLIACAIILRRRARRA